MHTIEVVVDRLVRRAGIERRLTDSLETALRLAEGVAEVEIVGKGDGTDGGEDGDATLTFSQHLACPNDGTSFDELAPRSFSFNSPYGACPHCDGLGTRFEVDPELVVPNPDLTVDEGAIAPWAARGASTSTAVLSAVAESYGFSTSTPWKKLKKAEQKVMLFGSGTCQVHVQYRNRYGRTRSYYTHYEGVIPYLQRRHTEAESDWAREQIEGYMREVHCPECDGARLKPESLGVTVDGRNIHEVCDLSIGKAAEVLSELKLSARDRMIAERVVKEINARVKFLLDVGLDYLSLNRSSGTLAGGEAQRIRLASQIGSGLVGVLYVLDEPSIGLHQRDNRKLIDTLLRLRDLGNTRDRRRARRGDHPRRRPCRRHRPGRRRARRRDRGVGLGRQLGEEPQVDHRAVPGGQADDPGARDPPRAERRLADRSGRGRAQLEEHRRRVPARCFVTITGSPARASRHSSTTSSTGRSCSASTARRSCPVAIARIEGDELLDKVINIDQSPIGRTPRSNPATYTGVFDSIRKLFSQTQEARVRGYLPGRFSFNVKGGRCEACAGDGTIKIEMHFLPDVYVPCEVCKGARYNRDTLDIMFKGKSIAEVLDLSVRGGARVLRQSAHHRPPHAAPWSTSGLGYVRLGQPAPTLSGGEAQRVKLSAELAKRSTGHTIYILDEPTTGLHFEDIRRAAHRAHPAGRPGQHRARDRAQPRRDQDRRLDHRPRARGRRRRGDRCGRRTT